MAVNEKDDFENRHDVIVSIIFEMYGIKRVPGDKIIDALRMLDVVGDIVIKVGDMDTGNEIYKQERLGVGEWI